MAFQKIDSPLRTVGVFFGIVAILALLAWGANKLDARYSVPLKAGDTVKVDAVTLVIQPRVLQVNRNGDPEYVIWERCELAEDARLHVWVVRGGLTIAEVMQAPSRENEEACPRGSFVRLDPDRLSQVR